MNNENVLIFILFLIFGGAAILATVVLLTRQSLLVAYMILGVVLGPWGLKVVPNAHLVKEIGDIGILFLLFLLGLHLDPRDLWKHLQEVSWISLVSSIIFLALGYAIAHVFGFTNTESLLVGAAMMFSSTIIGLKLLPAQALRQEVGHIMVGLLLLQDIIAIAVMLFLKAATTTHPIWRDLGYVLISLPILLVVSFVVERFILRRLFRRFGHVQEYIFLVAIAWCLCMAQLASHFGLPEEMGAFIAGVAIAEGPAAHYMAESLMSLRDFFLVMFFFTVGASFDLSYLSQVIIPAAILAILIVLLKPWVFDILLRIAGEKPAVSREAAVRLGQASEFSLILAAMAATSIAGVVDGRVNYLIQATTMLTFIASCYWVVLRYPTPMGMTKKMRRE